MIITDSHADYDGGGGEATLPEMGVARGPRPRQPNGHLPHGEEEVPLVDVPTRHGR